MYHSYHRHPIETRAPLPAAGFPLPCQGTSSPIDAYKYCSRALRIAPSRWRLVSISLQSSAKYQARRRADLSGRMLRGEDLRGVDWRDAKLVGADLSDAKLNGATYDAETRWPVGFLPPRLPDRLTHPLIGSTLPANAAGGPW